MAGSRRRVVVRFVGMERKVIATKCQTSSSNLPPRRRLLCFDELTRYEKTGHTFIMFLNTSSSLTPPVISGLVFVGVLLLQISFTRISTSSLDDENRRRLQHMTTGQALIAVSYILPLHYCQILLLISCILIIYICFVHDAWYRQHFYTLLRPHERQYGVLPGAFYFLVGVLVVATVFPLTIARYSVLCLSYADPMASWVGSSVCPQMKIHSHASVTGCTACFLTALAIGCITLGINNIRIPVIGAVACTIAEAMPFWNDNVMIPIITASAVQWAMSF